MFYLNRLISLSLLSISFFLHETSAVTPPNILGHSCFNQVKFLAMGSYENNLNILLSQTLFEEIPDSGYKSGVINGTSNFIKENNTLVYGLAQCWNYMMSTLCKKMFQVSKPRASQVLPSQSMRYNMDGKVPLKILGLKFHWYK